MSTQITLKELIAQAKMAENSGNWRVADHIYAKARTYNDSVELVHQHAIVVLRAGNAARAATMLRGVLRRRPDFLAAQLQLAEIYVAQKRYDLAREACESALKQDPNNIRALRILGKVAHELDDYASAEGYLRHLMTLSPDDIEGGLLLGAVLSNDGKRFLEAEPIFKHVLEVAPESPSALHNYGLLKRFQGELDEAETYLKRACELYPNSSDFAFSLASCYLYMEKMDAAYEWFDRAVEIDPKNNAAQVYKAFALFHQGRMRDGWVQYEKRLDLEVLKDASYERPRWNGEDISGKTLLLISEQGMGDNIQFIRYVPELLDRGAKVIVATHDPLVELFKTVDGISHVMKAIPEPRYFYRYCSLMSLPYVLGTDENSVPGNVPYMRAPEPEREKWSERLPSVDKLKVGLCWRGNPHHSNDTFRSSSLSDMRPLLEIPDTAFYCLSKSLPEAEEALPEQISNIGVEFETFSDLAAVIESLDLVITVDTAVCHLAGALGCPVWTMLARGPDFRWGLGAEKSPWYPTMRLYRQERLGDWSTVIARMAMDLRETASKRISDI